MWWSPPETRSSGRTCVTPSDGPISKTTPGPANNTARVANRDEVVPILADVFRPRATPNGSILDEYDIPNAPVNDMAQVFTDPQVLARDMVGTYKHPTLGDIRFPPTPIKWSEGAAQRDRPMLGQHTIEVLTERLRCSTRPECEGWPTKAWSRSGRRADRRDMRFDIRATGMEGRPGRDPGEAQWATSSTSPG